MVIAASAVSETFRSIDNLTNVLRDSTLLALVAIGQTLVILGGGIDLSVGSVAKLTTLVAAVIMSGQDRMTVPAVVACLAIGACVGSCNGLLVTRLRMAPFIATFAAFYIVRGLAYTLTTAPIGRAGPGFYATYTATVLGIPVVVVLMAGVWLGFWMLLHRTTFGRHVYAVGGDESVARLAGISTGRVRLLLFIASGVLAAVGGLFDLSRIGIGDPNVGEGLELDSITAVAVGGTSLFGGRGYLVGTLGGVLFLATLNNVFNLLQVDPFLQQLIKGSLILVAIAVYRYKR